MTLGNAMNMANISYGMSGDKGNESYFLQHNGKPISLNQYNNARQAQAEAAAQRGGYTLLPAPSDPSKRKLAQHTSLFYDGPRYAPEPLTQEVLNSRAAYLARFMKTPEAQAYVDKVSGLIQSGTPVGYGVRRTADGRIIDGTGQELVGYRYRDGLQATPEYRTEDMAGGGSKPIGGTVIDNSTGSPVQTPQNPSNAFMDGLNANLANYDSYTVNSDLDAAEQSLRGMLVNAQNSNADASTIGRIQMALDDIGRLGQDRTRQRGIIDQARRDVQSNLTNFGTSYTDVDYRNAQALDSLSRQLDQITNPNLDVELNYDFSDLAGDVDPYREVVQNMRDRRMRELNALGEDIGGIDTSLSGFRGEEGQLRDIQSASEVYDIRDRLNEALSSLDVYGVGSRSNELRGQIFDQDEIYGQLADQLRGRQGQIEADAQAQLDALAEARLTRPDDIRSFEEALRNLSGQRDLFDAATAADELERLTDQVQRARSDLERDEAARIARQQLERMRALQTQGAAGFNNNYMTADDYSAYLRALEMGRDNQYFEGMGTSFSRALGLA